MQIDPFNGEEVNANWWQEVLIWGTMVMGCMIAYLLVR